MGYICQKLDNSWSVFKKQNTFSGLQREPTWNWEKPLKTHSCLLKQDRIFLSFKPWPVHNSPLLRNRQLYILLINSKQLLLICISLFKSSHPSSSKVNCPEAEKKCFLYECIIGHWWRNRHSLSLTWPRKKFLNIFPEVHVSQYNLHIIYKVLNIKNNGSFQLASWQMMIAVHFMRSQHRLLPVKLQRENCEYWPQIQLEKGCYYTPLQLKLCMYHLDGIQSHITFPSLLFFFFFIKNMSSQWLDSGF